MSEQKLKYLQTAKEANLLAVSDEMDWAYRNIVDQRNQMPDGKSKDRYHEITARMIDCMSDYREIVAEFNRARLGAKRELGI